MLPIKIATQVTIVNVSIITKKMQKFQTQNFQKTDQKYLFKNKQTNSKLEPKIQT